MNLDKKSIMALVMLALGLLVAVPQLIPDGGETVIVEGELFEDEEEPASVARGGGGDETFVPSGPQVDLIARYGGEEFVVLLPETGASGARIFAERVLRRVAAQRFGDAEHPVQITLSMGLATVPDPRVTDPDSFLAVADANLLKAKADGRNRYRD